MVYWLVGLVDFGFSSVSFRSPCWVATGLGMEGG